MSCFLLYSMDEPGVWYEYPAALISQGDVVGWVCAAQEARLVVNLYRFCSDPLAQASQLLARLSRRGGGGSDRFDVETSGPLLPGYPVALKWDGEVVAWLREESFGRTLMSVLNAFIRACQGDRLPAPGDRIAIGAPPLRVRLAS